MQFRGKQIPAWVLLLVILGAAAAAVAVGSSGATVLTGDTQVAVADKLLIESISVIDAASDAPVNETAVVHISNDRQSYMVNFIADEGDTFVTRIAVKSMAGIDTVVAIKTDAPEYFDVGYSIDDTTLDLGSVLRKIDGEWVLFLEADDTVDVYQHVWIKTKPPCPAGQYTLMTWIEQKFQS